MNPFWLVWALAKKTLMTSLGVLVLLSVAFSASVLVSLLDRGLREAGAQTAQDYDLVVGAPGSRLDLVLAAVFLKTDETLPLLGASWLARLRSDPRVAAVSPLVFADHYPGGPIVGVGADFPRVRPSLRLLRGRWASAPREVVAGASSGWAVGDRFPGLHGVHGAGGGHAEEHEGVYTVVGVLASSGTPWDRACLTPVEGVWEQHGLAADQAGVSALLVKPLDFAGAYALRGEFREGPTTAAFPGEVLAGLFGVFDQAKQALSWLGMLFQGLVLAAVVLSLLAGMPTQARWIGLLRALGAGPLYIGLSLWLQNAVVLAVAGVAAAALGGAAAQALAGWMGSATGLTVGLSWSWDETLLLGLFWLVGLGAAVVPAVAGYFQSVRQALSIR